VRIDIVSIFPEYFGPLGVSLIGKAAARGDIEFHVHDLREWAHDIHRTVDDAPFGGGPGMVMKAQVWAEALDEIASPVSGDAAPPDDDGAARLAAPLAPADRGVPAPAPAAPGGGPRLIVPTPSGVPFTQASAARYTGCSQLIFACGRYEGIDARFIDEARSRMPVDEVSIGDYVLAGGEAAVLVMVEAISRLLPGVLGNERSASDDSFGGVSSGTGAPPDDGPAGGPVLPDGPGAGSPGGWSGGGWSTGDGWSSGATETAASMAGLLEGPVYTRPRVWRGREVPEVLLSGDHAAIARWRRDAALLRTAANRPDLIWRAAADPGTLSPRDWQVLSAMGLSGVVRREEAEPDVAE
jgi:tRNA (guanine37-N1)-methyltransferase